MCFVHVLDPSSPDFDLPVTIWTLGLHTVPYYGYGRTIYGIYGPTLKLRRYGTVIRYGNTAVFTDKLPLTQNCSLLCA